MPMYVPLQDFKQKNKTRPSTPHVKYDRGKRSILRTCSVLDVQMMGLEPPLNILGCFRETELREMKASGVAHPPFFEAILILFDTWCVMICCRFAERGYAKTEKKKSFPGKKLFCLNARETLEIVPYPKGQFLCLMRECILCMSFR